MILSLYKKWKNRCQLPHAKEFGEPYPKNMKEIFRFSPYKKDPIGYGVHECSNCGKRMFSCCGYHLMGPETEKSIDTFIAHDMSRQDFIGFLEKEMKWYREMPVAVHEQSGEK